MYRIHFGILFVLVSFFPVPVLSSSPQFLGYVGHVPFLEGSTVGATPLSRRELDRGNFEQQVCKSRTSPEAVARCIFSERGISLTNRKIELKDRIKRE